MVKSEINAFMSIGKKIYVRGMTYNEYHRWYRKHGPLGVRPSGEMSSSYKQVNLDESVKRLYERG